MYYEDYEDYAANVSNFNYVSGAGENNTNVSFVEFQNTTIHSDVTYVNESHSPDESQCIKMRTNGSSAYQSKCVMITAQNNNIKGVEFDFLAEVNSAFSCGVQVAASGSNCYYYVSFSNTTMTTIYYDGASAINSETWDWAISSWVNTSTWCHLMITWDYWSTLETSHFVTQLNNITSYYNLTPNSNVTNYRVGLIRTGYSHIAKLYVDNFATYNRTVADLEEVNGNLGVFMNDFIEIVFVFIPVIFTIAILSAVIGMFKNIKFK